MKLILSDKEVPTANKLMDELIGKTVSDKSITKTSGSGSTKEGNRAGVHHSDLSRELAVLDVASGNMSAKHAAEVHGMSQPYLSSSLRGQTSPDAPVDEELKAKVSAVRHQIEDVAVAKLMNTLNLFEPSALEQKDLPGAATKMAKVIDTIVGRADKGSDGKPQVHLHLHAPRQKSESAYTIIEV